MLIKYSKQAVKVINSLDKKLKLRMKSAIEGLNENPPIGDIKLLKGYDSLYRLRVGKYRIIYSYETNTKEQHILYISEIGSRGDIYK